MQQSKVILSSVARVLFAAAVAVLISACAGQSLSRGQAEAKIREAFQRAIRGHADRAGASLLVHSDTLGFHALVKADPDGPDAYHLASIGKTFTAALVGKLVDSGRLRFEDKVADFLDPGLLDGLFLVEGWDFRSAVTVDQLLSHTSGLADYFDDKARGGKSVFRLLVDEPGHAWKPSELIAFTRDQLSAVGKPGESYHYSDTGYILLGLIIENIYGLPFETALKREILEPLGMDRTWMPYRSLPISGESGPIRAAWLRGSEVSRYPSISADWAGGGIASTEGDLLKFQKALWSGKLLSEGSFAKMKAFDNHFQKGVLYGRGLMQFNFGEYFFLLESYPKMIGHMGLLATQMFYDPNKDIHLILSLGSDAAMEDSVKLIIDVLGVLSATSPRK